MPEHVLFVCSGNTCRSPMAEALLRHLLRERGMPENMVVSSAGLAAVDGAPATEGARRALAAHGLNLDGHRSQPVTDQVVESADLILAMETRHRSELERRYPDKKGVIFTLKEYAGETGQDLDVLDPFGSDDEHYQKTAAEIRQALERIVERWKNEAAARG